MYGRNSRGSGLIETAAGLFILVPVLLILIDVAALVLAQTANDQLAKHCARAAAELPTGAGGGAATTAYNNYVDNRLCTKSGMAIAYGGTAAAPTVTVTTTILCTLPVPVPLGGPATQIFKAFSTEPVVGQIPQ